MAVAWVRAETVQALIIGDYYRDRFSNSHICIWYGCNAFRPKLEPRTGIGMTANSFDLYCFAIHRMHGVRSVSIRDFMNVCVCVHNTRRAVSEARVGPMEKDWLKSEATNLLYNCHGFGCHVSRSVHGRHRSLLRNLLQPIFYLMIFYVGPEKF